MNLKESAKQLKADIPAILLALKHPKTPLVAKCLAGLILIYALSPIDLIPDFIPVLGYLDDLIILPALIAVTIRIIPLSVLEECRKAAASQSRAEAKWLFALPFIVIWLLVLYYFGKWLMGLSLWH